MLGCGRSSLSGQVCWGVGGGEERWGVKKCGKVWESVLECEGKVWKSGGMGKYGGGAVVPILGGWGGCIPPTFRLHPPQHLASVVLIKVLLHQWSNAVECW